MRARLTRTCESVQNMSFSQSKSGFGLNYARRLCAQNIIKKETVKNIVTIE